MSLEERRSGLAGSVTAGAAIASYFSLPLQRFMPSNLTAGVGILLAICIAFVWGSLFVPDVSNRAFRIYLGLMTLAVCALLALTIYAGFLSDVNDVRCEKIENAMLRSSSKRTDLPELFGALGCRVQTRTAVLI